MPCWTCCESEDMIHRIHSDLDSLRELRFRPGLNLLVADKSDTSTSKQTRNGAGKTSLVQLIHFLLGETTDGSSIFRTEELEPWSFGLDFNLGKAKVQVKRSGTSEGECSVACADDSSGPPRDALGTASVESTISNDDWNAMLGDKMFGLPGSRAEGTERLAPTFRSLFPYFARRQDSGGFVSPISHSSNQLPWNQQVAISYLVGLDWSLPQRFENLRDHEKTFETLRKSAGGGTLPGSRASAASLRSQAAVAESKAHQLKRRIDSFNVVPEYQAIEREASDLTQEMNRCANENTADLQVLDQLKDSLVVERPPEFSDLKALYDEVNVLLPDQVARRFEEAREFHRVIVENRKAHLGSEIQRIERRLEERNEARAVMGERYAQLMEILDGGGALEQYALLQEEYARLQSETETLKQQLLSAERLESERTSAEIERRQLQERLRQDFRDQRNVLDEAIVLFEELSEALYARERAGNLTIDATANGPTFKVQIDAQRSRGIQNMQIFCFDMMLAAIASRRGLFPGFLVHDSHLFDGVDERQVAKALQIGRACAERCEFQYLVTMNSDALPQDGFDPGFDIRDYILPGKLDDTPTGGLFGIRFN